MAPASPMTPGNVQPDTGICRSTAPAATIRLGASSVRGPSGPTAVTEKPAVSDQTRWFM